MDEGSDMIQFRLMDHSFDITLNEWCKHFDFVNNDSFVRCCHPLYEPTPTYLFNTTSIASPNNVPKGKYIECHAVRYLYYVIAKTLQARGEFRRLNEEDIIVLARAAVPDCN